jgi:Fcf2 pre-rRNA processing.
VRKTPTINRNKDFDLDTNYNEEIKQEAKQIYEKNKIFDQASLDDNKIAPVVVSRLSKKIKKLEESQTTGNKWFNMKKNILTPEAQEQLNLIKLRGHINPNQFYKKPDWQGLPQYYQIGTVIGGGDDPKSMKIPKREKKGSLIDQFLAEDASTNWTKKKFGEIQKKRKNITRRKLDKFKKLKRKGVVRA